MLRKLSPADAPVPAACMRLGGMLASPQVRCVGEEQSIWGETQEECWFSVLPSRHLGHHALREGAQGRGGARREADTEGEGGDRGKLTGTGFARCRSQTVGLKPRVGGRDGYSLPASHLTSGAGTRGSLGAGRPTSFFVARGGPEGLTVCLTRSHFSAEANSFGGPSPRCSGVSLGHGT
jgi:hypothetical protein